MSDEKMVTNSQPPLRTQYCWDRLLYGGSFYYEFTWQAKPHWCQYTEYSDLDDLKTDKTSKISKPKAEEMIPEHFINLDHNKNNAVLPSSKPDPLPPTPELEHVEIDDVAPNHKLEPIPTTPEPSSNLDHDKADVEPPCLNPDSVSPTPELNSSLGIDAVPPILNPDTAPSTPEPSSNLNHTNAVESPHLNPESVSLTPEPSSNLDHPKTDVEPPCIKPNPVPLTPEPDSNLDQRKIGVVQPHFKSDPGHNSNLKSDALPYFPKSNPKESRRYQQQMKNPNLNQMFANLKIHQGQGLGRLGNSTISCENLQFGDGNVMNISSTQRRRTPQPNKIDEKLLEPYLHSTRKLETSDFPKISKCLGNDWKFIGRSLGIEDSQLDMFEYNNKSDLREICYKMLTHWASKDPSRCTVGNLAQALNENDRFDSILQLSPYK